MSHKKISHLLGHGFAHLQNTIDKVAAWSFGKLKKVGSKKDRKNTGRIAHESKRVAKFFGEMGTEYFKKYSELKQKIKK